MAVTKMTSREWQAEAVKRFGKDSKQWKFVCPTCKHVQSLQDFIDTGMDAWEARRMIGFSCIGRVTKDAKDAFDALAGKGPCNYAGGGLFRLNPVKVTQEDGTEHELFDFAEAP